LGSQRVVGHLVLALLLFSSGCSFVVVHGPPRGHERMESFSCTRSYLAPLVDGVFAFSFFMVAASSEDDSFGPGAATGWPFFFLHGSSSVVGFRRVSRCRAALEALAPRSEERENAYRIRKRPSLVPVRVAGATPIDAQPDSAVARR
jgi:hypothetical protein